MDFAILNFSGEATLEEVGGKGLNLVRLVEAGAPVPPGFILPTSAYRAFVIHNHLEESIRQALTGVDPNEPKTLETASGGIQKAFLDGSIPKELTEAVLRAWKDLGAPPVAVRSSATAEDLPDLSFAGQQETYLNVTTAAELLEAIRRAWASLWTPRAIGYRARNGISQQDVALAVVVQQMVRADVSGVMFTANPLTGKRTETVIEATLGLGEALVSGQVEPDRYTVVFERGNWKITARKLGEKDTVILPAEGGGIRVVRGSHGDESAFPDAVVAQLAEWGRQIQNVFAVPQDIEWAVVDPFGEAEVYILQSRPITSLFPLPKNLDPEPLRVLVGLHVVQGYYAPLTPTGQDALIRLLLGVGSILGFAVRPEKQKFFYVAGERLWLDVAEILKNRVGRRVFPKFFDNIDPPTSRIVRKLAADPAVLQGKRAAVWRPAVYATAFAGRMIVRAVRAWANPEAARKRFEKAVDQALAPLEVVGGSDPWETLEQALAYLPQIDRFYPKVLLEKGFSAALAGLALYGYIQREAKRAARILGKSELALLPLELTRGLPHNVTTEMDLSLWQVVVEIKKDPEGASWLRSRSPAELVLDWKQGKVPAAVVNALRPFLEKYGLRGVGEIDVGQERWEENPQQIFATLQSYLNITDPELAPEAVFAQGSQRAEAAILELEEALMRLPLGRLRARLVVWSANRFRQLAGLREAPKFAAVRMLGLLRRAMMKAGLDLHRDGVLDRPDDLFFLHLDELARCARQRGVDEEARKMIRLRRAEALREGRRVRIPRVLLSDGTAFYESPRDPSANGDPNGRVLTGDPVSPGVVEGVVRVVRDPRNADLEPGEILVCHGTDPSWTPLFLVAGGLVMEVGGMMTHGAVVAREYGIPAVAGIHGVTEKLKTGQRVRVDGAQGSVVIMEDGQKKPSANSSVG